MNKQKTLRTIITCFSAREISKMREIYVWDPRRMKPFSITSERRKLLAMNTFRLKKAASWEVIVRESSIKNQGLECMLLSRAISSCGTY